MKAIFLVWVAVIERWLSHGQVKIVADLNSNLLLFHLVCVRVCAREKGGGGLSIDHIIPAFPVPLNLIMSPNQPIITKCQRSVGVCVQL